MTHAAVIASCVQHLYSRVYVSLQSAARVDRIADTAVYVQGMPQDGEFLPCSWGEENAAGLQRSEIREALRTIAGLYLRADVSGIRDVIEHYHLADILTKYLCSQYKQSATLAGLGLQLSKAFVVDALTTPDSRSVRHGLDMVGDMGGRPRNFGGSCADLDKRALTCVARQRCVCTRQQARRRCRSERVRTDSAAAGSSAVDLSRKSAPVVAERRQVSLDMAPGDSRAGWRQQPRARAAALWHAHHFVVPHAGAPACVSHV